MRLQDLQEASPLTVSGSFSSDLMENKLWLFTELANLKTNFSTIYVLGAWYGNISLVMDKLDYFEFNKIINVEINSQRIETGKKLAKILDVSKKVRFLNSDANNLKFKQVDENSLIINNSCNDIQDETWFKNIPDNTWVALQGRNNLPKAHKEFNNLKEFKNRYKLSVLSFLGEQIFEDPETEYKLFMMIGKK